MYLNFISDFFNKFSWTNVISIIIGIGLGLMIAGIFYGISVLESIKKTSIKLNNEKVINIEKQAEVNLVIEQARNKYNEEKKFKKITDKLNLMKEIIPEMVSSIASIYYPNSKRPMFEISIEEAIKLSYYINQRIEGIFDYKVLNLLKKTKLSTIIGISLKFYKVETNKAVKSANIFRKVLFTVKNAIDPTYYIRKALTHFATKYGIDKVSRIIIDIVGEESAKVYSKSLFISNDDLSELEKELQVDDFEEENI